MKKLLPYLKSEPSIFIKIETISPKEKKIEFEKKNVLFLVFFGMKFEKVIVIFEIRTPKFLYTQSFIQKERTVNLGPKTLIWVFGAKFEKIIVIISIFDFVKNEF